MQTAFIEQQLHQLFEQHFGFKAQYIKPLSSGGSARKYYRLWNNSQSAIGTINLQKEENLAFFSIQKALARSGIRVPEVYRISNDLLCYLQQDLGDSSLFAFIEKYQGQPDFETIVEPFYRKALSDLAEMQIVAHQNMDYSVCWPDSRYGHDTMLADLNYFYYYFVRQHPQLHFNESLLLREFNAFAGQMSGVPDEFLMYRDFQSRNIQLFDGELYYIDFQGIRKGPLPYDPVSLLFQVKAALPAPLRQRLLEFYVEQLVQKKPKAAENFFDYLPWFIYLRLFQVLGAYGFRGLVQRKAHFLQSIPYALNELGNLANAYPLPKNYPQLKMLIAQMERLRSVYPLSETSSAEGLHVRVTSFSYLNKGIPTDTTGNGGGFVFDCRILPNPGRKPEFAGLTGLDEEVIRYLENQESVTHFLNNVKSIVHQAVNVYISRKFNHLMVNFGCTGGRHRSVYCASQLSAWLQKTFPDVKVTTLHNEQLNE